MWDLVAQAAEQAAAPRRGEGLAALAALLTAVGGLVGVLLKMSANSTSRVDTITASQIQTLTDERDRARAERDEAIAAANVARQEADRWESKTTELTIRLARVELINEWLRKGSPPDEAGTAANDDATQS